MKQMYVLLAILTIFGIASILPQDALAQPIAPQPFESLRMEWQQDRAETRENRLENRAERITNRIEKHQAQQDLRAEIKERALLRIASSTDDVRAQFIGQKKEALEGRLNAMYKRFDGVIARLNTLADKIEDRIAVAADAGNNVTDAEVALAEARDNIDTAEALVTSTQAAITEALKQEATLSREGLRELVIETTNAIRTAHQALANTITTIKAYNQ